MVDKEKWISSFQIIRKLKKVIYSEYPKLKIGHAGTLDPFATGLMIILLGKGTKKSNQFIGLDKEYFVTLELGYETTTYDSEGEVTFKSEEFKMPTFKKISTVLQSFVGKQAQMPPKFSAKKVSGTSAYKLAREGKEFELQPKEIEIYKIEVNEKDVNRNLKQISFRCKVSSGTYIRSLVVDFGRKLGTYANAIELRRTRIGNYELNGAIKSESIEKTDVNEILKYLLV